MAALKVLVAPPNTWAVVGGQGPKGDTGAASTVPGPAGADGSVGPQGLPGTSIRRLRATRTAHSFPDAASTETMTAAVTTVEDTNGSGGASGITYTAGAGGGYNVPVAGDWAVTFNMTSTPGGLGLNSYLSITCGPNHTHRAQCTSNTNNTVTAVMYITPSDQIGFQFQNASGAALTCTPIIEIRQVSGVGPQGTQGVPGPTTAVRWRASRAASSVGTGDQQHLGTGTFPENVGGWTGAGTAASPLIVPSTGSYAISLFYSGVNWGGVSTVASAAIIESEAGTVMLPMQLGTTVRVGGTATLYLTASSQIQFKIRNNSGAAQSPTMYAEVVKIA